MTRAIHLAFPGDDRVCLACGGKFPESATRCSYCGTRLLRSDEIRTALSGVRGEAQAGERGTEEVVLLGTWLEPLARAIGARLDDARCPYVRVPVGDVPEGERPRVAIAVDARDRDRALEAIRSVDSEPLTCLAVAWGEIEAAAIRSALTEAGIAFQESREVEQILMSASSTGGIRFHVLASDLEKARSVLEEAGLGSLVSAPAETDWSAPPSLSSPDEEARLRERVVTAVSPIVAALDGALAIAKKAMNLLDALSPILIPLVGALVIAKWGFAAEHPRLTLLIIVSVVAWNIRAWQRRRR